MSQLPQFLQPAPTATGRPVDPNSQAGRYVRSFLFQRLIIGWLGWGLAPILVFVDRYLFSEHPFPRDSLSAYYWSGAREWFILSLVVTGFFLIAYKVTESNLDNTLSLVAGFSALLIPIFPTSRTSEERAANMPPLTATQKLFGHRGEHWVQLVHYGASFAFIAALGGVCLLFGLREGKRRHPSRFPPEFWRWFHITCAIGIAAGGLWIAISHFAGIGPYWSFLAGEAACSAAFGLSWFAKGFEIKYVLGKRTAAASP